MSEEEKIAVMMPIWLVKYFAETQGATEIGRCCRDALYRIKKQNLA